MIKTDGHPTIAWAEPYQLDPIYRVLQMVRERFAEGVYKWHPMGGPPVPVKNHYECCVGMALSHTWLDGTVTTSPGAWSDRIHDDDDAYVLSQEYAALALDPKFRNNNNSRVADLYRWNDKLDPKSAKRAIIRLLDRAMQLRKKDVIAA